MTTIAVFSQQESEQVLKRELDRRKLVPTSNFVTKKTRKNPTVTFQIEVEAKSKANQDVIQIASA